MFVRNSARTDNQEIYQAPATTPSPDPARSYKSNQKSNFMTNNETLSSNPNAVSRISAGMAVMKGEIVSLHDIRFDGDFEGTIISKGRIIIGETAHIKADIVCANLDIWGQYEGTIFAKDTLSLKAGCSVKGNINMGKFVAELGSRFDGVSKMINDSDFDKVGNDAAFAKFQKQEAADTAAVQSAPKA